MSNWKSVMLAGAAAIMPLGASAVAAAPEEAPLAQDVDAGFSDDAMLANAKAKMQTEIDAAIKLIENIFEIDKLPAIEPARLTLAQQTMAALVPAGSLERMLDNLYGKMFRAVMGQTGGLSNLMLSIKTGVDSEQIATLDAPTREAVADLFDPHREEREEQINTIIKPLISEVLIDMEQPMRDGMARAYARKFSAEQLTGINGFLVTPVGKAYAAEWMTLQADPEVMIAVVKAIPPLATKFIDRAPELEGKFKDLPREKELSDLSDAELAKLAKLMKVDVAKLKETRDGWNEPAVDDAGTSDYPDDAAFEAATDAADAAEAASDFAEDPAADRSNWTDADLKRVEAAEAAYYAAFDKMDAAQAEAIENARKRLPPTTE